MEKWTSWVESDIFSLNVKVDCRDLLGSLLAAVLLETECATDDYSEYSISAEVKVSFSCMEKIRHYIDEEIRLFSSHLHRQKYVKLKKKTFTLAETEKLWLKKGVNESIKAPVTVKEEKVDF